MSGTQFDMITTRYEYCEVLSPPSVCCNQEFPYTVVPVTSFGGLVWVPRWYETAGNKEKQREKHKDIEEDETENATKTHHNFVAVFVGHFSL